LLVSMKSWSGLQLLCSPWEDVCQALWLRYPNSYSPHVTSEDTLARHLITRGSLLQFLTKGGTAAGAEKDNERSNDDSVLYSVRLLTKKNPIPDWVSKLSITRTAFVHIIEHSLVDRSRKQFVTVTENINQRNSMCVTERCVYSAATKDDSNLISNLRGATRKEKTETIKSRLSLPNLKKSASNFSKSNISDDETKPKIVEKFSNYTIVKREVWVTSHRMGLATAIESFGKQKYKVNVRKTLAGLIEVLERLKK